METISELRNWFLSHVRDGNNKPYLLDEEQTRAVSDNHVNTLVSARAGSGKTHTLVAKIIYQIAILEQKPNDIMAFVFNKKAANEINERLSAIVVDGVPIMDNDVKIASTFHSFSHKLVTRVNGRASFGKILMDGEKKSDTKHGRALYIQAIINQLVIDDEWVRRTIYAFFRKESTKIDRAVYSSPEEYYEQLRNHGYMTLDGNSVKSFSEKIISDFFFENGIDYKYEPEYYPKNFIKLGLCKAEFKNELSEYNNIKGDFYLKKEKLLWEHWAIRGDESQSEIKRINESGAIGEYDEYKSKKNWKRRFYSRQWRNDKHTSTKDWYRYNYKNLIDSYHPINQSRVDFESYLKEKCTTNGIKLTHYSHEELVRKAWKKQVKYFTTMITSFIDRTQQMHFDDIDNFESIINNEPEEDDNQIRIKRFHQIGIKVYKEYLNKLSMRAKNELTYINDNNEEMNFSDYGTDFSILLQKSLKIFQDKKADSALKPEHNIKLILVDEYQDFSRLFYENLIGIRDVFPEAKLFCVGDDWQAINRFAGSDDKYFANFSKHFSSDSAKLLISNNYRSFPEIVEKANSIMHRLVGIDSNEFAKPYNQDRGVSIIKQIDLSKLEVAIPPDKQKINIDLEKYIETIGNLIIKHKDDSRILILHRKHDLLYNFNLWGVIRYRVRDYVTNETGAMSKTRFDEIIHLEGDTSDVMTVHKSKGVESETVILLEVDPSVFPSENNNTELFSIFGDNFESYKKDEARLYYVALTRAKRNIYVLWGTQKNKSNEIPAFINALN